jgi:hypothetical protein
MQFLYQSGFKSETNASNHQNSLLIIGKINKRWQQSSLREETLGYQFLG